jgi:hypothetical protein
VIRSQLLLAFEAFLEDLSYAPGHSSYRHILTRQDVSKDMLEKNLFARSYLIVGKSHNSCDSFIVNAFTMRCEMFID